MSVLREEVVKVRKSITTYYETTVIHSEKFDSETKALTVLSNGLETLKNAIQESVDTIEDRLEVLESDDNNGTF